LSAILRFSFPREKRSIARTRWIFCAAVCMEPELARYACGRPQVGPVRIVKLNLDGSRVWCKRRIRFFVQFGLSARQSVFQSCIVPGFSKQAEEQFLVDFYFWHDRSP